MTDNTKQQMTFQKWLNDNYKTISSSGSARVAWEALSVPQELAPVIIGSNIQRLGERLAYMLDDDQFNGVVEYLDAINAELQARASLSQTQEPIVWMTKREDVIDEMGAIAITNSHKLGLEKEGQAIGALYDTPLYTHAPNTAQLAVQEAETAWLVERNIDGFQHYLYCDCIGLLDWTPANSKALRFSRKQDAESICSIVEDADRVAEHMWLSAPTTASITQSLQHRVKPWMFECFGEIVANDKLERGDRLLEETLETLQSGDYPMERISVLVKYVYNRPKGEPSQEVGGVMITLAAYCLAHDLDMHDAGEIELMRILQPEIIEKIRAKQAKKAAEIPFSPLPVVQPDGTDKCPPIHIPPV